jgi:beta-lactamase class A
MDRRHFSLGAGAALLGLATTGCAQTPRATAADTPPMTPGEARSAYAARRFADIERNAGCRLGVAVLDTHTGARYGYRQDERFPMCSTFKTLASGLVLARVDAGQENLDRRIRYTAADLVQYSPGTEKHVGGNGMMVGDLCEVMTTLSDNSAANLLLASFGGPAGLTAWLRSLGDPVTRLDRNEPELNSAIPGDPRDTTSPAAMASTLRTLALGTALSAASRELFVRWLVENKTGNTRLRAGVPAGWIVGDKTGTGTHGTHNDIAVMWPPGRAPIVVTTYLTEAAKTVPATRDMAIREVARWVSTLA